MPDRLIKVADKICNAPSKATDVKPLSEYKETQAKEKTQKYFWIKLIMDRQLNISKELLWSQQNFRRKSLRTLYTVKLLEMHIKRGHMAKKVFLKTKNINTKDMKSLKAFASLLVDFALLFFSDKCIKVAYSVFTMNVLLVLTNRSID